MSDTTLSLIRENVDSITKNIDSAKKLISALSEAGEDTSKLSQDLRSAEIRLQKWQNMLKNRGL
jgi:hypothetical protein